MQLNALINTDGVQGIMEGNGYHNIDVMFPIIFAVLDKTNGYAKDEELKKVNSLYSENVETYERCSSGLGNFNELMVS